MVCGGHEKLDADGRFAEAVLRRAKEPLTVTVVLLQEKRGVHGMLKLHDSRVVAVFIDLVDDKARRFKLDSVALQAFAHHKPEVRVIARQFRQAVQDHEPWLVAKDERAQVALEPSHGLDDTDTTHIFDLDPTRGFLYFFGSLLVRNEHGLAIGDINDGVRKLQEEGRLASSGGTRYETHTRTRQASAEDRV